MAGQTIEFKGKTLELDEDGFLQNPELWDEDIAEYFAKEEHIPELTEEHWKVIN